ncbi:hypothetical protein L204_101811 [Cryptococcus depauperatus]|nr:hypothetical protein L204_04217 [Cryptococcus depauperatus CBS 7855]
MPRVTKRQKEAGKVVSKPKSKPRAPSGSNGNPKHGFNVKPARAPKDAYLGKAKKIKANLIQRAKVKKQYAKVLRQEGMESERLGNGSRRRGERDADTGKGKGSPKGTERHYSQRGKPKHENQELEAQDPEMARILARAGPSGSRTKPFKKPSILKDVLPPKARALSPSPPPTTSSNESKPSIRQLRKESFGKYHRPKDSIGLMKGRGQPNMGARMGVLLEKIKRDIR